MAYCFITRSKEQCLHTEINLPHNFLYASMFKMFKKLGEGWE